MNQQNQDQILETLREIRDGQQEMIKLLAEHKTITEGHQQRSREMLEESMAVQRLAVQRQRNIGLIAAPAILACIAAIVYLVWRYF